VDESICDGELNDFYLISQKASQGVAQPTHYYLAYDEAGVSMNDVYDLIYKLSYLYYNWSGSIRVPAPCQYAKKLVQLMGEKLSDKNCVVIPNETYEKRIKSLYFI
jgi:aubergine-like protein